MSLYDRSVLVGQMGSETESHNSRDAGVSGLECLLITTSLLNIAMTTPVIAYSLGRFRNMVVND